mgnify:CR=1 FL=1
MNAKIWDLKAEVFIPCAASRLITEDQLNHFAGNMLQVKTDMESVLVMSTSAYKSLEQDQINQIENYLSSRKQCEHKWGHIQL